MPLLGGSGSHFASFVHLPLEKANQKKEANEHHKDGEAPGDLRVIGCLGGEALDKGSAGECSTDEVGNGFAAGEMPSPAQHNVGCHSEAYEDGHGQEVTGQPEAKASEEEKHTQPEPSQVPGGFSTFSGSSLLHPLIGYDPALGPAFDQNTVLPLPLLVEGKEAIAGHGGKFPFGIPGKILLVGIAAVKAGGLIPKRHLVFKRLKIGMKAVLKLLDAVLNLFFVGRLRILAQELVVSDDGILLAGLLQVSIMITGGYLSGNLVAGTAFNKRDDALGGFVCVGGIREIPAEFQVSSHSIFALRKAPGLVCFQSGNELVGFDGIKSFRVLLQILLKRHSLLLTFGPVPEGFFFNLPETPLSLPRIAPFRPNRHVVGVCLNGVFFAGLKPGLLVLGEVIGARETHDIPFYYLFVQIYQNIQFSRKDFVRLSDLFQFSLNIHATVAFFPSVSRPTFQPLWFWAACLAWYGGWLMYGSFQPPVLLEDSKEYLAAARNLSSHGVLYAGDWEAAEHLDDYTKRPPVYPLLLIAAGAGQGDTFWLRLLQSLLALAGIGLSAWFVSTQLKKSVPWLLWLLVLLASPGQWMYPQLVMTETLFQFLLLGLGISWWISWKQQKRSLWWLASFCLVLALLTKPVMYLFVIAWVALGMFAAIRWKNARWLAAPLLSALLLLGYMQWNQVRTGLFHMSSIEHLSLLQYTTTHLLTSVEGPERAVAMTDSLLYASLATGSYAEHVSMIKSGCYAWIGEHPGAYLSLHLRGMAVFFLDPGRFDIWSFFGWEPPASGWQATMNQSGWQGILSSMAALPWAGLLLLGLGLLGNVVKLTAWGLFLWQYRSQLIGFVSLVIVGYLAFVTGTSGASRFAVPLFPWLLMATAVLPSYFRQRAGASKTQAG